MRSFRVYFGLMSILGYPAAVVFIFVTLARYLQTSGEIAWLRQQYVPHAGFFYRVIFSLVDAVTIHPVQSIFLLWIAVLWAFNRYLPHFNSV